MQSAVPTSAALTVIAFNSFRTNRVVVLGGIAVMLFFAFTFCVTPVNKPHVPTWAVPAVFVFVVSSGLVMIVFVVADVRCWLKGQWKAGITDGGPGKHETK